MNQEQNSIQFSRHCQAAARAVYRLLVDIRAHREWAGEQQRAMFHLISLEAPEGPARPGSEFTSRGNIPGSSHEYEDRSVVTAAEENRLFAFTTYSSIHLGGQKVMQAEYEHRYEITPAGENGCTVSYSFRQVSVAHPMARFTLPVVRDLTWGIGIPMLMRKGFDNLLKMAEKGNENAQS